MNLAFHRLLRALNQLIHIPDCIFILLISFMRMSTHNLLEANDSSWKILVNATQRAYLAEGHTKTQRKRTSQEVVKSYEEFVQELSQINRDNAELPAHDHATNCAEENVANDLGRENTYILGEWNSDNEFATDDEYGCSRKDENNNENYKYKVKNSNCSETSSNISSGRDDIDISCEDEYAFGQDKDENDWESLSSCSEDLTFEQFLKDIKKYREDNDDDSATKYTSLTECVIHRYYPESESENHSSKKPKGKKDNIFDDEDYNKEFRRHGQLKLEQRIPLMQVIDALEDVNKILKNGEITPNMERVLEYKQDYPFTEGYEEEKLGWCPYIVYKIEKLVKKLAAKQWPY